MQTATLGRTGIRVSRLCFGTLTLGPLQANLPLDAGARVLAHAIGRGVHFADTAQLYGTYPYIRRAMALTGKRDLVVSTKTYAYTRELAAQAVDEARRGLDRDYIDLFLLHEQESAHTLRGHAPALEYLLECKQRGTVRAVGASMHHIAAVHGAVEHGLDVIHPLLNKEGLGIVDGTRDGMRDAVARAHGLGLGVFSMKPLGGGNLFRDAAACLRYALDLDCVDAVAVGMQSVEEVDANLAFFAEGRFPPAAARALAGKRRRLHIDSWCEGCGTCASRCGQDAIRVEGGRAVCDHAKCLLCSYCAAACPAWAIKII